MDFYAEFKKLLSEKPRNALAVKGSTHAAFSDYVMRSKNIYLCFFVTDSDECYYSQHVSRSHGCMDCSYIESCEFCYSCFDCHMCRDASFLISCGNCSESEYLLNCYNCQNCFGCVGLMNKQHCILNRQFSPEEYGAALAMFKKNLKEAGTYGKSFAEILQTA